MYSNLLTNNPSMLKLIELIKSEKENVVRKVSVFSISKVLCIRNSVLYSD